MVAPSLEMVTEPLSSWMSLSIPRGPRVVRTTSATAVQALMLLTSCGFPCEVSVPSFRSMICGCSIADMVEDEREKERGERELGFKFEVQSRS